MLPRALVVLLGCLALGVFPAQEARRELAALPQWVAHQVLAKLRGRADYLEPG
ncbi:hypothetical protein GCM10027456_75960 [Kineosporia babensis]